MDGEAEPNGVTIDAPPKPISFFNILDVATDKPGEDIFSVFYNNLWTFFNFYWFKEYE